MACLLPLFADSDRPLSAISLFSTLCYKAGETVTAKCAQLRKTSGSLQSWLKARRPLSSRLEVVF